ncbi:MAG: DUF2461 family protein, partial [Planctomycetaceae bacterium]|nr:DUF2461 family protein [Planctomycetaceae bacterium]
MSFDQFTGFTPQTLEFFKNLDLHNNRKWFQKHRSEYVEHVFNPAKQLAAA